MPYASGPSVRRLSKIATLLLAKNYIVMLQRTVDELRRLLVDPPHQHGPSTKTPTGGQRSPSPYDTVKHSAAPPRNSPAAHKAVDAAEIGGNCAPPRPEVILAMTSLPPATLSERARSQLSEGDGCALDWSAAAAAVSWQRQMSQRRCSVTADYAAMISAQCHPSAVPVPAAGGRLLLPWIDYASAVPLPLQTFPVTDAQRGFVCSR